MANTKVTSSLIESGAINAGHVTNLTSAHIAEGSNLYHTDARSRASISVGGSDIAYNSSTGVITGSRPSLAQVLGQGNSTGSAGIAFPDNQKALFGTGSDLQIHHDGTNNLIQGSAGTVLYIQAKAGENSILAIPDGAVTLYHNNQLKFETTSTGISVNQGKLTISEFTGSDNYTQIRKTNTGSNLALVSQESIYMMLDENNDQTNRSFQVKKNSGAPGSGSVLFIVEENGNSTVYGSLAVTGDLNITGDINSVSVTDLDVVDKTITLGRGQTESASGGSGIIVDGSSASLLWDESTDIWDFNKGFEAGGKVFFKPTSAQTGYALFDDGSNGGIHIKADTSSVTTEYITTGFGAFEEARFVASNFVWKNSGTSTRAEIDSSGNFAVLEGNMLRAYRAGNSAYAALFMDSGEKLYIRNSWGTKDIVMLRTGEVGIGTASPLQKLDVRGGNIFVGGYGSGNDYGMIFSPADGSSYWNIYNDAGGELAFCRNITIGSSEMARFDGTGNFGIGTNNPSAKLNVKHTGGTGVRIETDGDTDSNFLHFKTSSSTGQGYIGTEGNTAGANFTGSTAYAFVVGSTSSGVDTQFLTAGAVRATIDHTGKVGIGTTSPAGPLHVDGHTGSLATILEGNGNGDTVPLHFRVKANNNNVTNHGIFGNAGSTGADNFIHIGPSNTSGISVMSTGNVGIGTNNPGVELDIQRTANSYPLRIGSSQGEGRAIVFADVHASPNKYNWITGSQYNVNDSFEITPSTAVGGYTFNNPSMVFKPDGQVLINKTGSDVGASTNILEIDGNVRIQGGHYGIKLNNGAVERYLGRLLSNNSLTILHDKIGLDTNNNIKFSGISQKAITIENSPASNDVGVTTFLASNNASAGVGYAANIIGVNIANTVNSNNMPTQNNTWGGVSGASAFSMNADMTGTPTNTYFRFMRTEQDSSAGTELVTVASIDKDGKFVGGGATLSGNVNISAVHSQLTLTDTDDSKFVLYSYSGGKLIVRNNSINTTVNQFTLLEDGKFGIGTINPTHKLDVYGTDDITMRIHRPSSGLAATDTCGIGFSQRGDANTSTSDTRAGIFSTYNGNLFLATEPGGNLSSNPMDHSALMITGTSQKIGIGTINPQDKLHVYNGDIGIENSSGRRYRLIAETNGGFTIRDQSASAGRLEIDTSGKLTVLSGNIQLGASTNYKVVKGVYRKNISANKSFTAAFKVNGSVLGSQFRFSIIGSIGNVVINARYEILVNHSYDCVVQSLSGSYTETKVKVVSNGNEDCTVYVGANTHLGNTISNLECEVETFNNETISFDTSSPHTTAHFIHTASPGANTTFTGAMPTGAGTTTAYT